MGFLLFAFRKLQLQRRISQLEYRQVVLAQKLTDAQQVESQLQQALSSQKNLFSMAQNFASNSEMQNLYSQLTAGFNKQGMSTEESQQAIMNAQIEMTNRQNIQNAQTAMTNSIFEGISNSRLAVVKAEEDRITQEQSSIDSQLSIQRKELESVEKGEQEDAKQDTPKFGLA